MGVVYCRQIPGRGGSSKGIFQTTATKTWDLLLESKTDDVFSAVAGLQVAGTLPTYLELHGSVAFATARGMSINENGEFGRRYTITVTYDSKPISSEEKDKFETPNPLNRAPVRWVESAEYEHFTDKDRDGNIIRTSAGTAYPDPAVIPKADWILRVRQNFSQWPSWIFNYNNQLNDSQLTIKPSRLANTQTIAAEKALFKFGGISEPMEENGVLYVQAEYSLHVRAGSDGWKDVRVDEDIYYLDGGDKKRISLDGQDAVTPQLLDGNGGVLANPESATAVFNENDVIPAIDMSELDILAT